MSQSAPSLPHTISVRADNDAFDFWMEPWNRPDEEYTSGVRITDEGGDAPKWMRRWLSGLPACSVGLTRCRSGRRELGQDIYTPSVSVGATHAAPNARPNAGWLYVDESGRVLDEDRSDELTLSLGVTGPPSLAQFTQTLAHRAAPAFNRPTDWSRQIGFEPGVIARYEQRRRWLPSELGPVGFDLVPNVAVSAGNVATNAEVGFETRVGWHLSHPWLPSANHTEVALVAGATGRAVARDLFLDGNTFYGGPRVGHEPFVGSGELGLTITHNWASVTYRAVEDTRSYAAGPKTHPWASMVAAVTYDR
jgi:hypothetical protein